MADLNESIKKIVKGYVENCSLTDYKIGTIVSVSPLRVKISERLILDKEQLLLTEQVIEKRLDFTHEHNISGNTSTVTVFSESHSHSVNLNSEKSLKEVTIQEGLKVNDKVLILSVANGQIYIVLSKLRNVNLIKIDKDNNWSYE